MKHPPPKEEQVQRVVCNHIRTKYPDVVFISDLSGIKLPIGLARKVSGLKSSRGIPDLFIAEPRGEYHGYFIELKRANVKLYKKDGSFVNEHISEQYHLLSKLNSKGYLASFCMGTDDAIQAIDKYLA